MMNQEAVTRLQDLRTLTTLCEKSLDPSWKGIEPGPGEKSRFKRLYNRQTIQNVGHNRYRATPEAINTVLQVSGGILDLLSAGPRWGQPAFNEMGEPLSDTELAGTLSSMA